MATLKYLIAVSFISTMCLTASSQSANTNTSVNNTAAPATQEKTSQLMVQPAQPSLSSEGRDVKPATGNNQQAPKATAGTAKNTKVAQNTKAQPAADANANQTLQLLK